MTTFRPLNDGVLLLADPPPAETVSGFIVIPHASRERPQQGIVAAVGPGKTVKGTRVEMTVKEGDVVLYGKYAGTEIVLDEVKLLILNEEAILGIIQNGEATEAAGSR